MPHPATILLVEDNPDDEALTVMALRGVPATLEVVRDGQEAMDYLTNDGSGLPRLVLLDLKLPKIHGLEVLRRIREDDHTRPTPVVVLTSSNAPNDVVASYRLGANSYVRKPVNFDQFSETIRQLGTSWLAVNEPPPSNHVVGTHGTAAPGYSCPSLKPRTGRPSRCHRRPDA